MYTSYLFLLTLWHSFIICKMQCLILHANSEMCSNRLTSIHVWMLVNAAPIQSLTVRGERNGVWRFAILFYMIFWWLLFCCLYREHPAAYMYQRPHISVNRQGVVGICVFGCFLGVYWSFLPQLPQQISIIPYFLMTRGENLW